MEAGVHYCGCSTKNVFGMVSIHNVVRAEYDSQTGPYGCCPAKCDRPERQALNRGRTYSMQMEQVA